MNYLRPVLSATLCLLITVQVLSQVGKINHRIFTDREGLELDRISTMVYDDFGFLWLGGRDNDIRKIIDTDKDLAIQRFNGKTFHNFPLPESDPSFIYVDHFFKREDGQIYVMAVSDKPVLLLFDPISAGFQEVDIKYREQDASGTSRIFNYQGANYVLIQYERTIFLSILKDDLSIERLFSFSSNENKYLLDNSTEFIPYDDFLIIGDDNFPIMIFDWKGAVLKRYAPETFTRERGRSVDKFWIQKLVKRERIPLLLINGQNGLFTVDSLQKEIVAWGNDNFEIGPSDNVVNDLKGDHRITRISPEGNFKIGSISEDGIEWMYDLPGFSPNSAVNLRTEDLSQDLWVGNSNNELHYIDFPSRRIQNFLNDLPIRAIHRKGDGNYLVATEVNGWFNLDIKSGSITEFKITENGESLLPNSARNIIEEDDVYWSNSRGNIIKIFKSSGRAETFRHFPVGCLERLTDSSLVYGTNGYNLMEFDTQKLTHKVLIPTDSLDIIDLEVFPEKQLVLAATDKGVLNYNRTTGNTKLFGKADGLEDTFMLMCVYDPQEGLLFGSRTGHVYRYKMEDSSFDLVYKDDLGAGIATIVFEGNTWWISTFNGLVAYNSEDRSYVRFSDRDGLSHNEGNRYSALQSEDGIFIGSISGLNFFKPDELRPERLNSELKLLKLRNYNADFGKLTDQYNLNTLNGLDEIILPPEHREIQLDFSLTNNAQNRPHKFRYRMLGEGWVDLGEQQSLRLANLAPGTYQLEIEALDFSGKNLGNALSYRIVSEDFFYNTWQFFLLVSLAAILLLLYLLRQAGLRQRLQRQFSDALLISQENERTRIAKDLHDSVGQQLTLIKKKAQNDGREELSKLTHNALEEVRAISRGLYPAVLKQLGLTTAVEQLLLEVDESSEIFISTEIDNIDDLLNENQSLNFYRLIQEILSNVIKHSEASAVQVKVKKTERRFSFEISDNGSGFDTGQTSTQNSLGLKTISERIRILGGVPVMKSKPGLGTTISSEFKL